MNTEQFGKLRFLATRGLTLKHSNDIGHVAVKLALNPSNDDNKHIDRPFLLLFGLCAFKKDVSVDTIRSIYFPHSYFVSEKVKVSLMP